MQGSSESNRTNSLNNYNTILKFTYLVYCKIHFINWQVAPRCCGKYILSQWKNVLFYIKMPFLLAMKFSWSWTLEGSVHWSVHWRVVEYAWPNKKEFLVWLWLFRIRFLVLFFLNHVLVEDRIVRQNIFTNNVINTCDKCVLFKKYTVITKMPANTKQ